MKKFLSLVLALIMTMSLVTISAGATEYRDLTDKDEIQYEEAVAVLNRIGVITGYEDGSFRPETELTRGAAAKIIVSLMIGPEAASALPNNASPYPDVPAGHTFAGVIGYCKTAGYISGYGDGTFKPANPLTGYAFAKMLLGAIGYKSNIEGFVDTGWTMNVARIGNVAGLFDRISFDGAKAVTRDEACQLALNTLKATMVDYGNANTVVSSTGEVLTVQGSKAQYVTSNNRDINANINRRVISATNNELTLEFGEEHFKDLRLEHDRYDPAYDIYGHPSNEWSYKKVTIGTFKLPADFTFEKQMAHLEDTAATKEKALGLRNYDTYSTDHRGGYVSWSTPSTGLTGQSSPFADATQIHINGWEARVWRTDAGYKQTNPPAGESPKNGQWYSYDARDIDSGNKELAPSLSEICDLTDNGVTVEVYVCPVDADFITDVVVTRTQLMEVDRVASDYVELDTISSDSKDPRKDGDLAEIAGYNDYALFDEVVSVKDNNYDAYNVLKELKSGDEVAIIPYTTDDGKTWEVGEAYVPETVSGALTNVDIYNTKSKADGNAVAITVGGTTYPIAQWNKDMREITGTKIKATKKDVTLYLDKLGNALLAKDVGNANAWIIVGDYYQAAGASGRVNWFVHGWTIKGDEVDLELGSIRGAAEKYAPGELVKYDVASGGNGEYELYKPNYNQLSVLKNGNKAPWVEPRGAVKDKVQTGEGIYTVSQFADQTGVPDNKYSIKSVNTLLPLEFYNTDSTKKDTTPAHVTGVHFDYNKATADPNRPVGTDAETAASTTGTIYCGEMDSATNFWTNVAPTYASNGSVLTGDYTEWYYRTAPYDGVKFIYVGFDSTTGEVEVINFVDGVQNVDYDELKQINRWWKNVGTNYDNFVASPAEAYVDKDGKVKAVVIKSDSAEANLKDLMVITDNRGANTSTKSTGAEAPTSGTYYTRQYVSGEDGFKEEKTGYFDKALSVGDVITGSVKSDGIIRAKYFHAASYTNRNPDGIYAKGIAPLKTQEGKNSGYAFYVGTKNAGSDAKTLMLGYGVNGNNSYPLGEDNCEILTGKDVLGVNDGTAKEGLIKVDSTTQFIDLRDGRPGDIDEIGDLFDLDNNANIELKLIVNGNSSSDGFRHAYAILILEAETGKTTSSGTVSVTAKDSTGKVIPAASRTGTGKQTDPYVYTIEPNTSIELTAVVTSSAVEESAKWTVSGADTTGKVATVYAPEKVGDANTKAQFSVTLYDKDKDITRVTETVYVEVKAGEKVSDTYTLTLGGVLVGKATVLANDRLVSAVDGKYTIAKDASVRVVLGDDFISTGSGLDGKTYPINGVNVTFTDSAKPTASGIDEASFKMTKDLDLVMFAKDNITGAGDEVVTITLNNGVTATYTPVGGSAAAVVSGASVAKGGVLKITGKGTGAAVVSALSVAGGTTVTTTPAAGTTAAASLAMGEGTEITLDAAIELWSATPVKIDGDSVTGSAAAKATIKTTNDVSVTDATGIYVPVGTTLTASGASGADSYFYNTDGKQSSATASTSVPVSGSAAITVFAGVQLKMDDTITATVNAVDVEADEYVALGKTVTFAAGDTTNNVVVMDKDGKGIGVAVASAAGLTKGDVYHEYVALTKGTGIDTGTTIARQNPDWETDFLDATALGATATAFGAKANSVVQITGNAVGATHIKVGGAAYGEAGAAGIIVSETAGAVGNKPSAIIKVGTTKLALSDEA